MPTSTWGPYTWNMFHTLSQKLNTNSDNFDKKFKELIHFFTIICMNLPCPSCKEHSIAYIRKYPLTKLKNKEELILYFFNFHNEVNTKLKKTLFDYSNLEKTYSNNNVFSVFITFANRLIATSNTMMSYNNKNIVNNFYIWFQENKSFFNI